MSDAIPRLNAALESRYSIERKLGEGDMATVFLARDLRHNRRVALKVLKPELAAVVGAERFLAEIETTANLQHPHILPLFDSGGADGFLFYVMPYVEGETLRDRLDSEHQLPIDDAVGITSDVAEALDYAHARGVIHRDIKPANILLQAGKPVISDFGIALAIGVAGRGRLTETGLSLGTPHYMSPEQATGDQTWYLLPGFDVREGDVLELLSGVQSGNRRILFPGPCTGPIGLHHWEPNTEVYHGSVHPEEVTS
jgi:serine/threonine-protein kinase